MWWESMMSGVPLSWTPLVFTGACPWCYDAQQLATASSRLWEVREGHICSHHSWGGWEIFRYASLWPGSVPDTLWAFYSWCWSSIITIKDFMFLRCSKEKKETHISKNHHFQGISTIWLSVNDPLLLLLLLSC